MKPSCFQKLFFAAVLSLSLLFAAGAVRGEGASVSALIYPSTNQVGQPFQLRITVHGGSAQNAPATMNVPGLEFIGSGSSSEIHMDNMNFSRSTVYSYTLVAAREGEYTIPSFMIRVGNNNFKTAPIRFQVSPAGSLRGLPAQTVPGNIPAAPPPAQLNSPTVRQTQKPGRTDAAFVELQLAKSECYVGETVPAKIRFYVDERLRCQLNGPPEFNGDGFSTPRLQRPDQSSEQVNGIPYITATFDTAVTPVKPGTLQIPPAKFNCIIQDGSSNSVEDFFAQAFGQASGGRGFGGARQVSVQSEGTTLKVKPLPSEGKPENFNGAIGDFALSAEASPHKVAAGEPVTLKLVITGKGNFDAFTAPTLTNSDGWRSYTPKENFIPTDSIGHSGRKTYEYLLIAQENKDMTPGAEFSYFDPAKQRYVTLHSSGIPVQVQAPVAQPSPAAASGTTQTAPTPHPVANATPSASPALPIETDTAASPSSFVSPVWDWKYLLAQGIALVILLAVLTFALVRKMNSGERARRRELQKQAAEKLELLERKISDRKQFYHEAVIYLHEETASRIGRSAGEITLQDILASRELDEDTTQEIQRIFDRNDELLYGSTHAAGDIESREREQAVNALRKFSTSHVS